MNPPSPSPNEALLTRWIDGQLTPEEAALMEEQADTAPGLRREKKAAGQLGALLREHLPASLDPPSPEFFTSSVMEQVRGGLTVVSVPPSWTSRLPLWLRWIREPWFAPLASAAAVAVAFLIWNGRPPAPAELMTQTYAPDPRVVASAFYSEEAGATVIDLQNLDAVPDEREIKPFDVATADPPPPGEPLILYAAADTSRPVLVLTKDYRETPRVTAVFGD
jgi:anti-sigma factor RsiW